MKTYQLAILATLGTASACMAQTDGVQCVAERTVFHQNSDNAQGPIASAGSIVAYTSGSDTLNLYDVSNLANPVLLSSTPGLSSNFIFFPPRLDMTESLVASSDYFEGVNLIDISDTANPSLHSSIPASNVSFVSISGDHLVVYANSQIEVYDISDPANPTLLDSINDPSNETGMIVIGTTICIADRDAGLRLFDFSDPSNITESALVSSNSLVWSVMQRGQLAVVATSGPSALTFIDVSDPYNPTQVQSTNVNYNVRSGGIFIEDQLALTTSLGVVLLDTTDISSIQHRGIIAGPDVLNRQHLTPVGSDFAMISAKSFSLVDVPESGELNSQIYNDNPLSPSASLNGIHPDGDYAYSYDSSSNSLVVIDISDPQSPTQAASYSLGETIYSIDYEDDIVYLGTSGALVQAIDVSDPLSPTPINSWNVSSTAIKVQISGDYLYAMVGNNGFEVYDVSSLQSPMLVSSASGSQSNENTDMHVSGDRLVTIQYSEGGGFSGNYMYIYDVSDPANPVALDYGPNDFGPLLPDYYAGGLQLEGHTLYITLGGYYHNGPSIYNGKFASYDISDDVELLDTLTFENIDSDFEDGAKLGNIMLDGDSAYVAPRNIGGTLTNQSISLFNIADPQNLEYIGASGVAEFLPTGAAAMQDDKIYLAGGGLAIFDASTSCAGSCPADLTGDGVLDFFDVSMFLSAFNTQDPVADFTSDGIWDFFDVSAFLGAYNAGCP